MAGLGNYQVDNYVVTVNGRTLKDWGETATPVTDRPIDPKRAIRRGMGGKAVVLGRTNPGREVELNLNPGSEDSHYLQSLLNSGAQIVFGALNIGTLEVVTGTQGVVINDADNGRAGMTITDDKFIMHFNIWVASKGGDN